MAMYMNSRMLHCIRKTPSRLPHLWILLLMNETSKSRYNLEGASNEYLLHIFLYILSEYYTQVFLGRKKPILIKANDKSCSRTQHLVLAGVEPANWLTHDLESDALPLHLSAPRFRGETRKYLCPPTPHPPPHTHIHPHLTYSYISHDISMIYSRLSLSRLRLSRITTYLKAPVLTWKSNNR